MASDFLTLDLDQFTNELAIELVADIVKHTPSTYRQSDPVFDGGVLTFDVELFSERMPGSNTVEHEIIDPPFDMKTTKRYVPSIGMTIGGLLDSPKTKLSKSGSRYLVVPIPDPDNGQFRTVSTNSPANSWWFHGRTTLAYSTVAEEQILAIQDITKTIGLFWR